MINMNYNEENFMYSFLPSRSSFPPENSESKAKKKMNRTNEERSRKNIINRGNETYNNIYKEQ